MGTANRLSRSIQSAAVAAALLATAPARGQQDATLPHLAHRDGRHALIVDGKPFLMLGAQVHNSSAWPAMLPLVWPAMRAMHVNTVEIPIYWEQFEPAEGTFDTSVIDAILAQAREQKVRLVLLWFATWKNGSNHYMPAWMKLAPEKYPNAMNARGEFIDSPSAVVDATLQADAKAFAAFMAHLKKVDPQHTVIMVQVENEPGMWASARDHSPAAEKLFNAAVPDEALRAMNKTDAKPGATWPEAFGRDADEFFQVWCTARFIGQVAAAGKAAYPLPMYVNASVRDILNPGRPPSYQVGGPNDNVIPLWQAAAPAIDLQAPDIYARDEARYLKLLDAYATATNPLLVPETIGQGASTRFFYAALGRGAIGYAPFGLDASGHSPTGPVDEHAFNERFAATAANYAAIAPMADAIAQLNFDGKLQAAVESDTPRAAATGGGVATPDHVFHFGDWDVQATFGTFSRNRPTTRPAGLERLGRVLVADFGPGQFLIAGHYTRLDFKPVGPLAGKPWQYFKVEEGQYENGTFVARRILNGDQTDWGVFLTNEATALRVSVYTR